MPTVPQITTNAAATSRGMGKASTTNLTTIFPANPVGKENLEDTGANDSPLKVLFQKLCLDGKVVNADNSPAAGFMFTHAEFNRDFTGPGGRLVPPTFGDFEASTEGPPASAWVPNPTSPGPSMLAVDKPAPPEGFGTTANSQYGSGVGSALSVDDSSKAIANVKLGQYIKGRATITS